MDFYQIVCLLKKCANLVQPVGDGRWIGAAEGALNQRVNCENGCDIENNYLIIHSEKPSSLELYHDPYLHYII